MTIADGIGLIGAACYVAAHYAVQVRKHPATSRSVTWLNVVGPVCILVSMTDAFNMASFITQCFWLGLTLFGAVRGAPGRECPAKNASNIQSDEPQSRSRKP